MKSTPFTKEIVIIATDAPLLPHQLKRVAKRAALGMARTGSLGGNGSGVIFLAFSTANPKAAYPEKMDYRLLKLYRMTTLTRFYFQPH